MRKAIVLCSVLWAGCGTDNVGACEQWLETVSCGDFDATTVLDCSIYESVTCDVSKYFDCLTDNTGECNEETNEIDISGWSECDSLLVCK